MAAYICDSCATPCRVRIVKGTMDYTSLCVVSGELGLADFKVEGKNAEA